MSNPILHLVFVYILFLLNGHGILITQVDAKSKVHIVYLGERQHKDPKLITDSHHDMLANIVGSMEIASKVMVYSYKHGFSGFAAKLTDSQAQKLAELPGVVRVMPNTFHKLQTTRSWDYLGLSSYTPNNLLHTSNMGDGAIIGVFDSGIWPESKVFNDEGLDPIPSHWKGVCDYGEQFNPKAHCNKKVIGARFFINGFLDEAGQTFNLSEYNEYMSPRDAIGHGTHVSSIALGSYVGNISYKGLSPGTVRGGAPRARLAIYKVCWRMLGGFCSSADVLKAFDEAMHDGVNVLSLSIGFSIPLFPEVDDYSTIDIGSFHAVAQGITVVCSASNDGPTPQSVSNTAPWIITVAASTIDRAFPTPITLGNNKTILGQSIFTGNKIGFTGLFYPAFQGINRTFAGVCENLLINPKFVVGKVVLCFTFQPYLDESSFLPALREAGVVGLIIAKNPSDLLAPCTNDFPCIEVSYEAGTEILSYIRSTRSPMVKLSSAKTHIGKPVSPMVAYFSSRGPNSIAPAILKPDIAAPGSIILAATSPDDSMADHGFGLMLGTSMATPHVSGIVALLKSLHPNWSPAAIKSALVTTASNTDGYGFPIFAEGSPRKIANPFDFGGGIANPNGAAYPGLVYDMGRADYIHYLCAMGYNTCAISRLTEQPTMCPNEKPSILNVNLPSITIPNLNNSATLTRTVTNVGPINSIYKAVIEPPMGTIVSVRPNILVFNSSTKRISFIVTVSSTHQMNTEFYFGSLTWIDGAHVVRSPISVRGETIEYYADDK